MRNNICALLIILCFASSAAACLNDSELPDREREFRSQYLHETLVTSHDSDPSERLWVMKSTAIVLLAGAIGMTWLGRANTAKVPQKSEADHTKD